MNVSWEIPVAFLRLKTEDIILLRTEPLSDIFEGDPVTIQFVPRLQRAVILCLLQLQ